MQLLGGGVENGVEKGAVRKGRGEVVEVRHKSRVISYTCVKVGFLIFGIAEARDSVLVGLSCKVVRSYGSAKESRAAQ